MTKTEINKSFSDLKNSICKLKKSIEAGVIFPRVANYSLLPAASDNTDLLYIVENSQGTYWLPGSLGGTFYVKGFYYSNGTTWLYAGEIPYNATQGDVNTGTINDQFVTPATLKNSTQWGTKANTSHTHSIADVTNLQSALDSKLSVVPTEYITELELMAELSQYILDTDSRLTDSRIPLAHTHAISDITDFNESVEDIIGNKIIPGVNITTNYNDVTGETTINSLGGDINIDGGSASTIGSVLTIIDGGNA